MIGTIVGEEEQVSFTLKRHFRYHRSSVRLERLIAKPLREARESAAEPASNARTCTDFSRRRSARRGSPGEGEVVEHPVEHGDRCLHC